MAVEPAVIKTTGAEAKTSQAKLTELIFILLIAGTGFFVDVYDIVLFSVLRVPSLASLGVTKSQMMTSGVFLLNMQLVGMIVGGFIWGVIGDKKGRKASLFGSIFLYSLATFLNGFVTSLPAYAILRFLAGLGLAGEVGAALTIAAEVTPAKYRGYGTAFVRGLGALGGVLACVAGAAMSWQVAYITAGLMGFVLLLARMSIKETDLFVRVLADKEAKRGSIKLLLCNKDRLLRLVRCVLAVVPFWFVFGILVSFAPEVCSGGRNGAAVASVAAAAMYFSIGAVFGESLSGTLSQVLHSRKLAMYIFLFAALAASAVLLVSPGKYYAILCLPLGFLIAYNVVVNTSTAEQFGTNLRATATTLAPNFVRASAIPITLLFSFLATKIGATEGAMIAGAICFICAIVSIWFMPETFAADLDFIES